MNVKLIIFYYMKSTLRLMTLFGLLLLRLIVRRSLSSSRLRFVLPRCGLVRRE